VGKAHLQRPTDLAAPSFTDIQQAWMRPIPIHCKADIVSGIFFFFFNLWQHGCNLHLTSSLKTQSKVE
jgi:hypothetical protein